jgi:hypothetical protein
MIAGATVQVPSAAINWCSLIDALSSSMCGISANLDAIELHFGTDKRHQRVTKKGAQSGHVPA